MFTFLVSNSDVDYRLVEKYFPNCCWTTPIGKLARATRDWIGASVSWRSAKGGRERVFGWALVG